MQSSQPVPTSTGNGGAIATLEPTPTPAPTVRVTAPPLAEAKVVITEVFFKPWADEFGYKHFQLIVEVENQGSRSADLSSGSNDYTIYDTDDAVLETGSFSYSFPQILAPGATGYFIEGSYFDDDIKIANVGKAEPDIHYTETTESQALMQVTKVRIGREDFGDGIEVTGVVKNNTTAVAEDPVVGVVLFNSNDKIIGAVYENTLGQIDVGDQKGFKTSYPGTPPIKVDNVKGYKAYAYSYEFFF